MPSFDRLVDELGIPAATVRQQPDLLLCSYETLEANVLAMRAYGLPDGLATKRSLLAANPDRVATNLRFLGEVVGLSPERVNQTMLLCKPWQLEEQWERNAAGRDASGMGQAERAKALRGASRLRR